MDTINAATFKCPNHAAVFSTAIIAIRQTHARFFAGEIKPVEHAHLREQHLRAALKTLAFSYGVSLQEPLQIDSNGEFSLVALKEGQDPRYYGSAAFGDFVTILNPHRPRTGIAPSDLSRENGWCLMNHFAVEEMVMQHAAIRGV
jgi:hypothetical protein